MSDINTKINKIFEDAFQIDPEPVNIIDKSIHMIIDLQALVHQNTKITQMLYDKITDLEDRIKMLEGTPSTEELFKGTFEALEEL